METTQRQGMEGTTLARTLSNRESGIAIHKVCTRVFSKHFNAEVQTQAR